ncbi:MAG: amino acid permease [Candidatus Freyarchaeota archaeon]|nr:amino acid permease [Candidatus Jordarchaeia archaeon]
MMLEMDEEDGAFQVPYERRLIRRLNLAEAVTIGVGASIGAGIFTAIKLAVWEAGIGSILTFSLCGATAFLVGYSYIKLSSIFPESGASYTYIARAFKHPFVVFVSGCTLWFAYVVACSTYTVGFANYFGYVLSWETRWMVDFLLEINGLHSISNLVWSLVMSSYTKKLLMVALTAVFTVLNIIGVSETGRIQTVMVVGKVLILLFFVAVGFAEILSRPKLIFTSLQPEILISQFYTHYIPLLLPFKDPLWATFSAVATILIAFEGFDLIPTTGEELKDPKVIGKAIFITIITILIIYTLTLVTLLSLVPWYQIGESEAPLAEAMRETWLGGWGEVILAVGGILSTASAFNATLFGASRLMYAMAREKILPERLSYLSRKERVPYISILSTSLLSLVFALTENLELVASMTGVTFMLIFLLVSVSNVRLKSKTKSNVIIPLAAIALLTLFLLTVKLYITGGFLLLVGAIITLYFILRRTQAKQGMATA